MHGFELVDPPGGRLRGREFEKLIEEVGEFYEREGIATIGRYGVSGAFNGDTWRPIKSLPDFEGVWCDGRQIVFDAKVCSQSSFPLNKFVDGAGQPVRQLKHMLRRCRFGVRCFFLIHWSERILKTRTEPAETWRFPVDNGPFWKWYEEGMVKSITKEDCRSYGQPVSWCVPKRGRKPRPMVLEGLY